MSRDVGGTSPVLDLSRFSDDDTCVCGHEMHYHKKHNRTWCLHRQDGYICECIRFRPVPAGVPKVVSETIDTCATCGHPLTRHVWDGCKSVTESAPSDYNVCRCKGFTIRKE